MKKTMIGMGVCLILLAGAAGMRAATTTFSFEQDDEDGIALRITGEGRNQEWGNLFRSINSPSGLWNFPGILLATYIEADDPDIVVMWLSGGLGHRDFPMMELATHPFGEFLDINGPLLVRENSWEGSRPEQFETFEGENFFRIDERPDFRDPDTWSWTAFFSFRRPSPVPEGGVSLLLGLFGLLVMRNTFRRHR